VLHGPTRARAKVGISRLTAAETRFLISIEGKTRGKRLRNEKLQRIYTLEEILVNDRVKHYGHVQE
jgi:hypothetical protein